MRIARAALLILTVASALALGAAEPPVQKPTFEVTLALVPDAVLPGLPVKFRVTVANLSNVPAEVPQDLRLEVEPVNGERFFARALERTHSQWATTFGRWPEELPALASKQTATVTFPTEPLLMGGPEWFRDPRLNKPGVYRLRLLMCPPKPDAGNSAITAIEGDNTANLAEPVVSNVATLTVHTPEGPDASVWAKMQELAGPEGWNTTMLLTSGIAEYVTTEQPTSQYFPYFVHLLRTSPPEKVRAFRAAIATAEGPQRDEVKLALGFYLTRLAKEAPELAKAYEYADLAREEYRQLLTGAETPEARRHAEASLAAVPDRAQLRAMHQAAKSPKQ